MGRGTMMESSSELAASFTPRYQNHRHRQQGSSPLKAGAAARGITPIIASAPERWRRERHPVPWCRGVLVLDLLAQLVVATFSC